MNDLEITRLCAKAMGTTEWRFNPLHNDGQALALVKKCSLKIWPPHANDERWCVVPPAPNWNGSYTLDLNRAICECVAMMKVEK